MATSKKERDFQTYLLEKISREDEAVTVTSEAATRRRDDRHPRFEVWEYAPSNKFKKQGKELKREPIYLSGPAWSIPLQASTVQTIYSLMSQSLGSDVIFEEWFERWQNGFSSLINRPGTTPELLTNFPVKTVQDKTGWREEIEARPQYLEWKHPTLKLGYRVIEYFPKGKLEPNNSVVFTGSDWQIINQILNFEWQKNNDSNNEISRETPLMGGHPQIILYFAGNTKLPGHSELTRMRLGFRLMNKTEHLDYAYQGETVLTEEDIKLLTQKIKQKYKSYSIQKGDKTYSYTFKQQGYRLWSPLKDRIEAVRVFKDIVEIQGHSFRDELVAESSKPIKSTTNLPKQKTIIGTTTTIREGYSIDTVYFRCAVLHLPISKKRITIVK